MNTTITGVRVAEGRKPATVSCTVTVPASSPLWGLSITTAAVTRKRAPDAVTTASSSPSPVPTEALSGPIRYAGAVLKGQADTLASISKCFDSDTARIKRQRLKEKEDSWILESSEFSKCTSGTELLFAADDIIARIHQILALYCNFVPVIEIECIIWTNANGESLRTVRGTVSVNVISSNGVAALKNLRGRQQPLGSAILEAMSRDAKIRECLALHGDAGLSWSQVYDVIDLVGGIRNIVKTGYATSKQAHAIRQTANHYRHQGLKKKPNLPVNPPTLEEGNDFARGLLKRWICTRLEGPLPIGH